MNNAFLRYKSNVLGFKKPKIITRISVSALVCGIGYICMNLFIERYTIMVDYTGYRCLDARVLLVDKFDKTYRTGDIVAIDGLGVPVLPDENKYIKIVAGESGDTITFDGTLVENDNGYQKYAPLSKEYDRLKEKHHLASKWIMKENEIFLIGDTMHSLDARVVGPSNPDFIIGKAYVLF